ncbi:hypothetical protein AJ80_02422 [Polytolypa hystricis UAMH7299]|uniref:Required for respiratory growth protein 9, mitochondrial n=1 Tax=Polytolypa hystricis (strain UAMH7299) TaxID=1447883 RepID=A0A2B7YRG2_POLH7|nr:hypothetical protein AJ80_02422 [Polytolypa hystricis UAMH7299]
MSRTTHPGVATATSVSMKNRSFHSTSARLSESPAVERDDSAEPKPSPQPERKRENWQVQKEALKVKFQDGWHPKKKLSPDAMEGIRHLHAQDPERFSTPFLANEFKVPAEAIRRILKSKWRPSGEEVEDRRKRWEKRNVRIWNQMAEIGLRPKRKAFEKFSDAEKLDKK